MSNKLKCFVIGPIGPEGSDTRNHVDMVYEYIISAALKDEYVIHRADKDPTPGSISKQVIIDTINADLVVAILTEHNANAFYELGIRHAGGKPTIPLIADGTVIPFDNIDQRTIHYSIANPESHKKAASSLRNAAEATRVEGYKDSNPITQAIGFQTSLTSGDDTDKLLLILAEKIDRLNDRTENLEIKVASNAYIASPSIPKASLPPSPNEGFLFGVPISRTKRASTFLKDAFEDDMAPDTENIPSGPLAGLRIEKED